MRATLLTRVGGVSTAIDPAVAQGSKAQSLGLWGGACFSFALPFVVYLRTLAPSVYGLDSAELTTGAFSLGLVHAPGYPLYLLIGHLFTRLPIGNVGFRMNLMSAFFGALAVAVLYIVLCKLCRHFLAALSAVLLLAFSFFFWSPAVMAEVYTLHAFLMAALILVVLIWRERRERKWLLLLAFTVGLSLGNHLATALLLPGLQYWILATDHKQFLRPRHLLAMVALFALGLSVYLYLPLRYAAHPPAVGAMQIEAGTWQDVLDVVSARVFWGLLFHYDWPEMWAQVVDFLYCLWGNFLGLGLVIGVLGIIVSFWNRRTLATGLALMFLANAAFFIGYGAGDKRIMFLPCYVLWAVWIGLGCDWYLERLRALFKDSAAAGPWKAANTLLFPGLVVAALVINYQHVDLSRDWRTYDRAVRVLDAVEPGAYVLATSWFEVAPLEYLHVVEQRRLDVTVLNMSQIGHMDLYDLIDSERDTRPLYLTDRVGWLAARYDLEYLKACSCYRIRQGGE